MGVSQAVIDELRRRVRNLVSLDTPQDQDFADVGTDLAIGFTPGLGQAQALRDFERSRRDRDALGMTLASAGMIPVVGGVAKVADKSRKAKKASDATIKALRGYDPAKIARQYPDTAPPVLAKDKKTGKEFLQKVNSAEALAVEKVRKAAQKDIEAGNYNPYFKVEDRFYVDEKNYPLAGNTLTDAMPKKQATIDKYKADLDTPEARERLMTAYDKAAKDPLSKDWYAMGQLEAAYVKELGEKAGRQAFKTDFADAMAATTGGADPTSNLLMAHYGNFLRAKGTPQPSAAYEFPYPIGGRFASGNMAMYDKVINQGKGLQAAQTPKRFNFSGNFQGHRGRATIDEQMSGGFKPGLLAPPGDSYGIMEGVVGDLARQRGVQPANFQDVAWAGLKGTSGKPMMQHVNESIERTARVTGMSPEEVVRKNLIRKLGPMYGVGAVGLGTAAMMGQSEDSL